MFGNLILILSSIIILILKASDRMLKKKYRKRYPAIMQWYYMQVVSKNSGIILSSRSENFIDEWSQCDFCFTNFGVILEYSILESSIRLSSTWSQHVHTIVRDTQSSCGDPLTWKAQIHDGGHRVNFDHNLPSFRFIVQYNSLISMI